ncbi:MAG: chemotaxis protein CheA [Candidatus Omnitrophica bacterium]|nr:chemotaxis protein CheA [Candidatus Omnitrophota bacterium]
MDSREQKIIISLVDDIAARSLTLDVACEDEIVAFVKQLKNIQFLCRQSGLKAIDEAATLLLDLIPTFKPSEQKILRQILACWVSTVQGALQKENFFAESQELANLLKSQFKNILSEQLKFALKGQDKGGTFKPRIPQLDLSEGTQILLEFITESRDHLDSAEESLLNLENSPDNAEELNKIFRSFHTIKGVSSFLNLEDIRLLSHETETLMDLIRKQTLSVDEKISELVFSSIDHLRKLLGLLREQVQNNGVLKSPYVDISSILNDIRELIGGIPQPSLAENQKRLGDILVEKHIISEDELSEALVHQIEVRPDKKIGEILVEKGAATKTQVERGLKEQKTVSVVEGTVKISVKKLDDLLDTMGELVITGTQVVSHPEVTGSFDARLNKDVGDLDRIIREIQGISMNLRLMPIRTLFQKMVRLIRDLSIKSGKRAEVFVSGEETEIDKNIIELISDPMLHMARNAIDHGIENAELRKARAKPEVGRVSLNAYHKSGNIIIEISDDGGGLDTEKILTRARGAGLVKAEDSPSEEKIHNLIFEPGFSTAERVTDVSGRGVGMDVVKRNIEQLLGKISIDTEFGKGTKFSIRLPLTLAIIEGIIVLVGEERYILPVFTVVEFIKLNPKDLVTVTAKEEMIKVHETLYPVVRMDNFVGVSYRGKNIEDLTGCLVYSDYGQVCILVDELLGQQQIVIKSLGGYFKDIKGLAGATILGDGKVGLILDVNAIASTVLKK